MLATIISASLMVAPSPGVAPVRERMGFSAAVLDARTTGAPALVLDVPFAPQAPGRDWTDPRRSEGCEEASVLMAWYWWRQLPIDPAGVGPAVDLLADEAALRFGTSVDASAADTASLLAARTDPGSVTVLYDVGVTDLRRELEARHLLIVPVDGTVLGNPNYRSPGPPRHMLVVRGYDPGTDELITNDPGTSSGEGVRYPASVFALAMRDYQTGDHLPVLERRTAMVVVRR